MSIRCILFDIGNTLIVDDGCNTGRMIDWMVIQAVPGACEEVIQLSKQVACYAVSSAKDSSNEEALHALEKVGYKKCFQDAFTQRSLGISKEKAEFFQYILEEIQLPANEVLMVGDHFVQDVLVPNGVGLFSCMYNPHGKMLNSAVMPFQNGEFSSFSQLSDRLKNGIHPSIESCLGWLVQYGATQNILQHVLAVASIAYDLALRFVDQGVEIDPILTHRGGLLHDIDKLHPKSSREQHGRLGAEILEQKDLHDLAEIVRYHVPPAEWLPPDIPKTWEQKLVFYADKLVNHQNVVTLEERMSELLKRYPDNRQMYRNVFPHIERLEKEVLDVIGETPESYQTVIGKQINGVQKLLG